MKYVSYRKFYLFISQIILITLLSTTIAIAQDTADSHFEDGVALYETGDYEAAYDRLGEALDGFIEAENRLGEANTHYYMGLVKFAQEEYVRARDDHFNPAWELYTDLNDPEGIARSLRYIARSGAEANSNYEYASGLFASALQQAQRANLNDLAAEILVDKANNFVALSNQKRSDDNLAGQASSYIVEQVNSAEADVRRAIDDYTLALQLFRSLEVLEQVAEVLVLRGNAKYLTYDTTATIFDLEEAAETFAMIGNQQAQANALFIVADAYHYSGDHTGALETLDLVEASFLTLGDEIGLNRAMALRGYIGYQENFTDAVLLLEQALNFQRRVGDNQGLMVTLRYLGEYYLVTGNYNLSRNYYDESLNIALANDDLDAEAWAFFGRGLARARSSNGELREALNDLDFGMVRFRDYLRDFRSLRYINNLQAEYYLSRQEYSTSVGGEGAIQLLEDSLTRSGAINDVQGQAESNIQLGEAYIIMARDPGNNARAYTAWGDFTEALVYLSNGADLFARIGNFREQAYALLRIGEIQMLSGRLTSANNTYDNALIAFSDGGYSIGQAQTYTRQAYIAYLNGNERLAYQLLLDAENLLDVQEGNPLTDTIASLAMAEVQMNLGLLYLDAEMFDEAEQVWTVAEATQSLNESPLVHVTMAYRADLFYAQGDLESARSLYSQVLTSTSNSQAAAIASRGLARIAARSDFNSMVQHFEDALVSSREIHDHRGEFDTFMAQGYVYLSLNDLESAGEFFASAEETARGVNNSHERGIAEYGFVQLFVRSVDDPNRIGIAEQEGRDAIFHANETGDTLLQIEVNLTLGDMLRNQSNYDDAISYYNDARELALQEGYLLQHNVARIRIATIYQLRRQYTLALNALSISDTQINCLSDINSSENCDSFTQGSDINPLISPNNIDIVQAAINRQFGQLYIELSQYSVAQESLQASEDVLERLARNYPQAEIELGYTQSVLGQLALIERDFSAAIGYYEDAFSIAERLNDVTGRALANYGLGVTYTVDDDATNDEAGIDLLNLAIVAFRNEALNARLLQESFVAQANYYLQRGDVEQATTYYYQAITEAQNVRDPLGEANILLLLGDLFTDTYQFSQAEAAYEDAERIYNRHQAPLSQAEALYRLGELNILRVQYREALENFNEMQLIYENENDLIGIAQSHNGIGRVYYLQARFIQALASHDLALNVLQTQREFVDELLDTASTITLEDSLFDALIITTEIETYQALATVRLALADFEGAESALEDARSRASETDNQIVLTDLTFLEGQLLYAQGDITAAESALRSAIQAYDQLGDGLALGNANIYLGRVLIDLVDAGFNRADNLNSALDAYRVVQGQAREFGDLRMEIEAWLGFGRVYNRQNNDNLARDNLSDALRQAELLNSEQLLISIHIEFGLFYEKQGQFEQAADHFLSAVDLIENVHSVMRVQTGQANFFAQNNLPYQRLVEHYIRTGQHNLAFQYAERGRSRTFIYHANREQIDFGENASTQYLEDWRSTNATLADLYDQQNELLAQQQTNPDNTEIDSQIQEINQRIQSLQGEVERLQSSIEIQETVLSQVVYVNTPSLEEIRQSLDPGTTMIAYYVVRHGRESQIYAFVITSEDFRAVDLGIVDLHGLVFNIVDGRFSVDNGAANSLSATLIGQLANHSDPFLQNAMQNDNWIIAPHSALNVLPFSILAYANNPDDETYIQYSPSASFYVALKERLGDVNPLSSSSSALVFGNPTNDDSDLPSLAWAEAEADTVAGLFGTSPYTDVAADERVFVEQANNFDIIHVAAHGVIEADNPLSSYLLLSNDTDGSYDGQLEVREIYTLQLQSRSPLIVLSACQTNIDNLVDGDEFQGLARAFLVSGSRGVVASLWNVDDEATSVLMESFHQYLSEGDHPSVALAKAQGDVRNHPDHNWEAPNFWASFVYIGI